MVIDICIVSHVKRLSYKLKRSILPPCDYTTSHALCSVARGGGGYSLKSMQNTLFFALLRLIFTLTMKKQPPNGRFGNENW